MFVQLLPACVIIYLMVRNGSKPLALNPGEETMNVDQIIRTLATFDEADLIKLNSAVVAQIKSQRNAVAAMKRYVFKQGDKIKFTGRRGTQHGEIVKVNRKKAIIDVAGERWNVPLSMIEAA